MRENVKDQLKIGGEEENKLYISVPKSLPLCILQLCTVFNKSFILAKLI